MEPRRRQSSKSSNPHRGAWLCGAALLVGACLAAAAPSPAWAQDAKEGRPALPNFDSIEELVDFLENWQGSPEELNKLYNGLSPDQKALVDQNFEFWSLEGGLLLGGGVDLVQGDNSATNGRFRLGASLGAVWPQGDYGLPVYYAFPDIAGPWALGFEAFAATDSFDSFVGGLGVRWAYEYIGWTPYAEIGPAVRFDDDGFGAGAHVELGYGNILVQGFVVGEYMVRDQGPITVMAGLRIPWLLATLWME